jgi:hypothetical protein
MNTPWLCRGRRGGPVAEPVRVQVGGQGQGPVGTGHYGNARYGGSGSAPMAWEEHARADSVRETEARTPVRGNLVPES